MKKLVSMLLVLLMLVSLMPMNATAEDVEPGTIVNSGTCGENLTWTLDSEGVLAISGEGEMYDYVHYNPEEMEGDPAPWSDLSFDWDAWIVFADQFITSVIIGNGVTRIGNYAFEYCSALTSITLPNSVTSIGCSAFEHCTSLVSITLPDSITSIGDSAFEHCTSLASVVLPEGLESIGWRAFCYCSALTSIAIPNSVTSIGDRAFSGCSDLRIVFDGTLEEWLQIGYTVPTGATLTTDDCSGYRAGTCGENLTWTLDGEGVLTISGEGAMLGYDEDEGTAPWSDLSYDEDDNIVPDRFIKSVVIENGVTSIGSYAFEYCSALSSVTIPNSVTSIGYAAFRYCKSLTSITIPEDVTYIGSSVFYGCSSLKEITFVGTTEEWLQIGCAVPKDVKVITKDDILENMTGRCFWEITGEAGNYTLTITGEGAMANYSYGTDVPWYDERNGIMKIEIGEGVTNVGDHAFYGCSQLTSITLPNSVTSIGYSAFEHCTSLVSITLPDSVTSIGDYAFEYCSSLTSITIGNSVTSIGDYAFKYCSALTSITLPDSVTSIGYSAFEYCSSLTSVTIPNSVTSIGWAAFRNCSALRDIYYGDSESKWEEYDFDSNVGVNGSVRIWFNNILFENGNLYIAKITETEPGYTWSEYSGTATTIQILDGVESIPDGAFSDFSAVTYACIPNTVISVGEAVFDGCTSLHTIYFGGTETEWAALDCTLPGGVAVYFRSVVEDDWYIIEGVLTLTSTYSGCREEHSNDCEYCDGEGCGYCEDYDEDNECEDCGGEGCFSCQNNLSYVVPWANWADRVTAIVIEDGVDSLPHRAFANFAQITEITLPDTLAEFGEYAFSDCTALETVKLPEGLSYLPCGSFKNCTSLRTLVLPESIGTIHSHAFSGCSMLREINLPVNLHMAYAGGTENIEFSNGSKGFGLDSNLTPASVGNLFEKTGTIEGIFEVETEESISNEVKLLFAEFFDELFSVTENSVEPKDAHLLQDLIWHFTNGKEVSAEWQQKCDAIRELAASGRVVMDYGYSMPINETQEAAFTFMVLRAEYESDQDYLGYNIEIRPVTTITMNEKAGEVIVDRYVSDTTAYYESGVAQVELTAQGEPYNVPVDIVLVIDVSSSMQGKTIAFEDEARTKVTKTTKMNAAKDAAKDFVTTVTRPNNIFNDNRIAIVEFFDYANVVQEMTHVRTQEDLDGLTKKIQEMDWVAGGGTNYDDPLKVAGNLLEAAKNEDGYANRKQVVIFMTDGAPGIYNRACPFYFEVYGDFSEREDSIGKMAELRSDVALDISDYFWQTGSPLDTKYSHIMDGYVLDEEYIDVVYCDGSSEADGYEEYGRPFTKFLNEYWYQYVMGDLQESEWNIKQTEFKRVSDVEPGYSEDVEEDQQSAEYLLAVDIDGKSHVLSCNSSVSHELHWGDDDYEYYIGPNGNKIFVDHENVTSLYPYFVPVTLNRIDEQETYSVELDTIRYGGNIKEFLYRCTDAYETAAIEDTFYLRSAIGGSRWIRSMHEMAGLGGHAAMPCALTYTEDGDLHNYSEGSLVAPDYFFKVANKNDKDYYLDVTKEDPNSGFYFLKSTETSLDPIPEELEMYMADDNIFGKRIKGTATEEQLNKWGIEGSPLNADVYTVAFALNTTSYIDDPAGGGSISFKSSMSFDLLRQMASEDDMMLRADDQEGLYNAYSEISMELVGVPIVATVKDTMGDEFDLQTDKTVNTEDGTKEISVEPKVTFGYYELDENGARVGALHSLETISFNKSNGNFVAVSDVLGAEINRFDAASNMINGSYIRYDMANEEFMVEDILLEADKQFVLSYWVHLAGSSEGTRSAGIYATNRESLLAYKDKVGRDSVRLYPISWLSWQSAATQIEYYLVNTNGEPVNRSNEVVPFRDRIVVKTYSPFQFKLASTKLVNGCLYVPEDYEMYNPLAHYSVFTDGKGAGRLLLSDTTGTTYVVDQTNTNGNGQIDNLQDYRNTRIAFAVTYSPDRLNMKILGAQAHVIHQHKAVDGVFQQEGLYTDGIRFGYEIDFKSMQAALEPNDYFNTGLLLMPMDRINATVSNTDYETVRQMSLSVSQDGTYTANHGSPVFVGRLGENDSFGKPTLDADSMILWTEEMENASSAKELCELLREQNQMKIYDVVGDSIRVMAYMKFTDETNRQSRADREIAFRAFFVTSTADGYVTFHSEQFANSATRIFNDYNWRHFGVSNVPGASEEELLQGASRLAPNVQ